MTRDQIVEEIKAMLAENRAVWDGVDEDDVRHYSEHVGASAALLELWQRIQDKERG